MVIRMFLSIDCKTGLVRRYVNGKRANMAKLPPRIDSWILAELETFRAYGPPRAPATPEPQPA